MDILGILPDIMDILADIMDILGIMPDITDIGYRDIGYRDIRYQDIGYRNIPGRVRVQVAFRARIIYGFAAGFYCREIVELGEHGHCAPRRLGR